MNAYSVKKEENEKKYAAEVQEQLNSILLETANDIEEVGSFRNMRSENWERLSHKMQVFTMLRQNIKEMFSLNHRKGTHDRDANWLV